MGEGYHVDVEQLRAHAANVEAIKDRFGAVKAAGTRIARDDQAYGLLCGWIAAVLEDRHTRQGELFSYVEENLALVAQSLRTTAEEYEALEDRHTGLIRSAAEEVA
ncbi:hypothetical protein FNH05_12035 [Amycolatopsis rhizosphaerae]|uniref:ESX-1 secretion-associated protein n=1 Tax=Amycolatopsis rhizosphaerae TaxID=2053003 RepID=A0A558CWZ4_9PSEU|nr:type VII secretion target [Amycolatopsis rhizosphaerae]TVT53294.1 hypothetical protein FNH05_12035 [Amycolatopsis rhizosphaerae]